MLGPGDTLAHRDTAGNGERPLITVPFGQTFRGGFFWSLQRLPFRRFVVRKLGRPALSREVRVAFWDGVRAGLSTEEAAAAAGAGRETARRWVVAAGGVKGTGQRRSK